MNRQTQMIVRATAELLLETPAKGRAVLLGGAVALFAGRCGASRLRTFPRLLLAELSRRHEFLPATLVTPTGASGGSGNRIASSLSSALGKRVELAEEADPALGGGALLACGDERYDASVRGALRAFTDHLRSAGFES